LASTFQSADSVFLKVKLIVQERQKSLFSLSRNRSCSVPCCCQPTTFLLSQAQSMNHFVNPPPNLENTRRANLQLKCDNLLITLKLKVMQITKIWKSYIMYKCITSSKTCRCIPPRMNYFTIIINFSKPKLGALA
jgi:hypothetical protein